MDRYMICVPHEKDEIACAKVIRAFLASGSHFLTHADWGCADDEHCAWITLEAESKDDARRVIPPAFRDGAKVIRLTHFTLEQVDGILQRRMV